MRSPSLVATIAALVAAPSLAAGEPPRSRLVYQRGPGAETCPDEAELRRAVALELGYEPFDPDAPRTVTARFERDARGLHATVQIREGTGEIVGSRVIDSRGACSAIAATVTLAIAIAIDPARIGAAEAASPPAPEPAPPTPSPATARPPEAPAPRPTPSPPPERPRFVVGAGAGAAFGTTPSLTASLAASVDRGTPATSLGAIIRFDLPTSTAADPAGRVSAWLLAVEPNVCLVASLARRLLFSGCAIAALGALRGGGQGLPISRSDWSAWVAAGPGAALDFRVAGPLWLRVRSDGLLALVRTRLQVDGATVWTSAPFAVSAGAAVLASIP